MRDDDAMDKSGADALAGAGGSPLGARGGDGVSAAKPVLDVCCGSRMFWFDKEDPRAVFADNRQIDVTTLGGRHVRIAPDVVADFNSLPFPDETFAHVVFDPPHFRHNKGLTGNMTTQYGVMPFAWRDEFRRAFSECFRVLRTHGTLIFKWCGTDVPLAVILTCTDQKPLYGHRSGKNSKTHWVAFLKGGPP